MCDAPTAPLMSQIEKIAKVLQLVNTDQRDATIEQFVEYVLFSTGGAETPEEVISYTKLEFTIELNRFEVDECITRLREGGRIKQTATSRLELAESALIELNAIWQHHVDSETNRKSDFNELLGTIEEVNKYEIDSLFVAYNNYLLECLYNYGKTAISILLIDSSTQKTTTNDSILKKVMASLNSAKLQRIFRPTIENLSENIKARELKHIEELAERSECFFSLGLSKELSDELNKLQPLGWTILLDTNVLYSILKLRTHMDDKAIFGLLELLEQNADTLDTKLRYLPETLDELKKAKQDISYKVRSNIPTINQASAALSSGNLDDFTEAYYKNVLSFGSAVQHPVSISRKSQNHFTGQRH